MSLSGRAAGAILLGSFLLVALLVSTLPTLTSPPIDEPPKRNEPPEAAFTWTPRPPRSGDVTVFNASSSSDADGTLVEYGWDFGDGTTSRGPDHTVLHTYATSGRYLVELRVLDDEGDDDSARYEIMLVGPLAFERLASGGFGGDTWPSPHAFLIREEARWQQVWFNIFGGRPATPAIDFSHRTVIAVRYGVASSGGHQVFVTDVGVEEAGLSVIIRHVHQGSALPAVTFPYDLVVVDGRWSRAAFQMEHVVPGSGIVAFGPSRPEYDVGSELEFVIRNRLSDNLTVWDAWTIYRDSSRGWMPVYVRDDANGSVTLMPLEAYTWTWRARTQNDEGLAPVEPGFYRIDVRTQTGQFWSFFWLR